MNIIFGIILMGIGYFFIAKTESFLRNFGRIDFFERHLGVEGGSRLGYKLIGIIIALIGLMVLTGMWGGFLEGLLSPLVKHSQPLAQ